MRHTKIVCTIGPSSSSVETLDRLVAAGMDVARLNFSHGTHAEHAEVIRRIRGAEARFGRPIAILQDLQGPKIRLGTFGPAGGERVDLESGQRFTLVAGPAPGTQERVSVAPPESLAELKPGDSVLMDDGMIQLEVEERSDHEVHCRVIAGGRISDHKGISLRARPAADLVPHRQGPGRPHLRHPPGRRSRRGVLRAVAGGHPRGADLPRRLRRPAADHRQDRAARGAGEPRQHRHPGRRHHGGARRSRPRRAARGSAAYPEGSRPPRPRRQYPRHRGHPDARVDGRPHAADARRDLRRVHRDPRRRRRHHALGGDGHRPLPRRGGPGDGAHGGARRAGAVVRRRARPREGRAGRRPRPSPTPPPRWRST